MFRPLLKRSGSFHCSSRALNSNQGIIKSVLYGKPGEDRNVHETHSKMLARGKYVHELNFHLVKPEHSQAYEDLVSKVYPLIAKDPENEVNLVGSWKTLIGDLDQSVHLWEFKGYSGYQKTLQRLHGQDYYKEFLHNLAPMLRSRENQICLEFSFWLTSPPLKKNGVYELRSYVLKPGHLLEWESYWKLGLECRKQFCQPVGAWFTQLGNLNTVHHMWLYPDLDNRKKMREAAWKVEGWPDTVFKTVPLIQTMRANILSPYEFSPLH